MPQARSTESSTKKSPAKRTTAKSTAAKPSAARSSAAKSAGAKSAAAKPAAAKRTAGAGAKSTAARSSAGKSTAAKSTTTRSAGAGKAGNASGTAAKQGTRARPRIRVNTDGAQIEAIAERLRKLNERIIEVGREAGESRLASYEKALKSIATGISQGPAKDEVEWITHLAASQAKFVREITDSWAKAARERLR